jgi:hypothetical protein
MNQVSSPARLPWYSTLANGFQFPKIDRPVVAWILGASLFGGCLMSLIARNYDWSLEKFLENKLPHIVGTLALLVSLAYIGAVIFGAIAMVGAAKKSEDFWRDQLPVSVAHWVASLLFIALFLAAGMSVSCLLESENLMAKIKAEAYAGRITYTVALLLFSVRSCWYGLTFSFPRFSPCQYVIFFLGFVMLLNDFGIWDQPNPEPSRLASLMAWTMLIGDRCWRRAESFMNGRINRLGVLAFFGLVIGNSIITGYLLWCISTVTPGFHGLIVLGIPLLLIWFGSIVGLINMTRAT